ncbi:MAG: hypothetical protein AAGM67_07260 [Bacteroidota bacterium]
MKLPITFMEMIQQQKAQTLVTAGDVRSDLTINQGLSLSQLEAVQKLQDLCQQVAERSNDEVKAKYIIEGGRKWLNRIKFQQSRKRYLSIYSHDELENEEARKLSRKTDSPSMIVPYGDLVIPIQKTLFIANPNKINLNNFHQLAKICVAIGSEMEVLYLADEYDYMTNARINAFEILAGKYQEGTGIKSHRLSGSDTSKEVLDLLRQNDYDMVSMADKEAGKAKYLPDLSNLLIADQQHALLLF